MRDAFYSLPGDLYWTDSATGALHHRSRRDVGTPGTMFAINDWAIYGLARDRSSVWECPHADRRWHRIGGPASSIMAGGGGIICAINPTSGNIHAYEGGRWPDIGNAGSMWAVTGRSYSRWSLYGLTPNRDSIWKYRLAPSGLLGDSRNWFQVGPGAASIVTGPNDLFAVVPRSALSEVTRGLLGEQGGVLKYVGPGDPARQWQPSDWQAVGGPGAFFAASGGPDPHVDELYGVSSDRRNLLKWSGRPGEWQHLPAPAGTPLIRSLEGGAHGVFAVLDDNTLWEVTTEP